MSQNELSQTFATVVESTGKSVVRVEGRRHATSGVVWGSNQILAAAHSLDRDEVVIGTEDGERTGRVRGRDASTDVALVDVEGEPLAPASFDDGAGLKVGTVVLRLARPGETVRATLGIVSALGKKPFRAGRGGEIDRYLESDAGHPPGFSGGPLVGTDGAVVGMNTAGLIRGTRLTIPTSTLRRVVGQLSTHGRIRHSYLGLRLQPLELPETIRAATGEEVGLLVVAVDPQGPAQGAGIQYGDTILHLGDASVRTLQDLYGYLRADRAGEQVQVKLFRGGQVMTVPMTLGGK